MSRRTHWIEPSRYEWCEGMDPKDRRSSDQPASSNPVLGNELGGKHAPDFVVGERISLRLNYLGKSYATRAPDSIAHSPDPYARDEAGPSRAISLCHPQCP
ncbi:hypothetical protein D8674_029252 [Pyrus ussuriensis x Pyrus communis]|uniref:Uncharacterized protein n=1 Tax=Pyrus ussuriensis x Pyrus communis TaxID=2448454 RepID=A0A5N5HYI3_9ROSA|nr:hypothetical protein D8674_029252 [Pyrus ussuriensis x Pyrus communis]